MQNNIAKVDGVRAGIKLASDLIRPTYGPNGTNVIIGTDEYPYNMISNDAFTIIKNIHTTDPTEILGLNLYKELMDRQNSIGGDGRKTTAIIADKLLDISFNSEMPKIQLKKELDTAIDYIDSMINAYTKEMVIEDIYSVAKVSSESEEIANMLQEVYTEIRQDGVIEIEASNTPETSFNLINGTRFMNLGYITPAFANDGKKAVYENPRILITKQKINSIKDIESLLNGLSNTNQSLVILSNDIDNEVAIKLINTHVAKRLKILILKPPVLWKDGIFEDFAKCTGSTIIDKGLGYSLDKLKDEYLGTCEKLITDQEETILLGIQDISEHINELKEKGDNESLLRVNWLSNKTVKIRIGGNSEQDIYYKRMKCQDAVNSCKSALKGGVILGSGITLKKVAETLPESNFGLRESLIEPYIQLCINAGVESLEIDNIYDSAYVIKQAVRNAIGLASTVLTIGSALPIIKE